MKRLPSGKFILQMAMILWFGNVFILSALLSESTSKAGIKWIVFDCSVLLILDILCFIFWKLAPERPAVASYLNPKTWGKRIKENWQITTALVLGFLQRFWMMNNLQRWDAGEYYYRLGTGCQNFDFSLVGFLKNFRLCLHPTYGMALITAPGEFLDPRGGVGVMAINLILTLIALYCLYSLFRNFFCHMSKEWAAFSAFFCLSLPLIWGTFGYYNPDYFIAVFLIFFIYAESRDEYLAMFFWGFCVSQCKETGIILLFGYEVARLIAIAVSAKGGLEKKIKAEWKNKGNWTILCVGMTYVIYAIGNGGLSSWKTANMDTVSTFSWNNDGFNCFGFNLRHIYEIIVQLGILNYSWILWLVTFGIVIYLLVRGKKRKCQIEFGNLAGLLGGGVIYAVFTSLYITYTIYRYHVFWILGTGILFCVFVHEVFRKWKLWKAVVPAAVLMLILGTQTFRNTDPIGRKFVRAANTGKGNMLFSSGGADYFGDYLVYNYEYTWIDKVMDAALAEAGLDEKTIVITMYSNIWGLQIDGNGSFYHVKWDPEKQTRTEREEGTMEISTMYLDWMTDDYVYEAAVLNDEGIVKDKAVVLFYPYYEENQDYVLSVLSRYYAIGEKKEVENYDGVVTYYTLDLRQTYGGHAE